MKRLIRLAMLGVSAFATCAAGADGAAVVAYWPFGTNGLMDVSGNGNHLHASASGVALSSDGALSFDGTQTFCQTRRPLNLRTYTKGLTIEFWFKMSGAPSGNIPFAFHAASVSGPVPSLFGVCINVQQQIISYSWDNSLALDNMNYENRDITQSGTLLADGEWHHLAWVLDPSASASNRARLYVDGTQADASKNYALSALGNGFFRLGCGGHPSKTSRKLEGSIDDVRITSSALSTSEFMASRTTDFGTAAQAPTLEPFTLAQWSFSRLSPLSDDAGLYALTMPQDGTVDFSGGAAVFSGLGGLSTVLPLDLMPYKQLTIEFWLNYPRIRDRSVIDKSFDMNFLELSDRFDSEPGAFRFSSDVAYMNDPACAGFLFKSTSGYRGHLKKNTYGDGNWHHWVCKIDNSGSSLSTSLSIDGTAVGVDSTFGNAALTSFVSHNMLNIGWRSGLNLESGTWKDFKNLVGKMDDIRISVGSRDAGDLINTRSEEHDSVAAPIARWTFECGNPYSDVTGNGNALEVNGAIKCEDGNANFDGLAGFATAVPMNLDGYRAVTVEMLICPDEPCGNDTQMILEFGDRYSDTYSQFYILVDSMGQIRGGLQGNYRYWPGCRMNRSEWTHLALVMDLDQKGFADQVKLYVNGEKAPGVDATYNYNMRGFRASTTLFLGARSRSHLGFSGKIDDVVVSEGALRPGTFVLSRPSPVQNSDDIIAYWPFNGRHQLRDETGNGYSLTNALVVFESGYAKLSGNASLATEAYLPFNLHTGLTVECFVCIPVGTELTGTHTLFKTTASPIAASQGAGGVELDATGVAPVFFSRWISGCFRDANGLDVVMDNVDSTAGSGVDIANGAWHHVAWVVDSTLCYGQRSRLFVDGQEMAEYSSCDADREQKFVDGNIVVGDGFPGFIDDVRITGRALSPAEFLVKRTVPKGLVVVVF